MDKLIFGLLVTVIGVLVVFFGLVVLIGLIKLMEIATSGMGRKKAPKAAPAPAPASAPAPVAEAAPAPEQNDDALIAVITAAVAAMMEDNSGFVVRRVRRISNTPAWSRSGREEQVYSRF